jgi:phosphoribosylanthranilate isomerase
MLVKVCGMCEAENIQEIADLQPDFMGFIFYPRSPRYVARLSKDTLACLPQTIKKVGVFVNEPLDFVRATIEKYSLDVVQFHADETPLQCLQIREEGCLVIKAFSISSVDDFAILEEYEDCCDYFLFDTKSSNYGGSGVKFDWSLLNYYTGTTPFLLSGGIGIEDISLLTQVSHSQFVGVDINSRFEIEPGVKDVELVSQFLNRINKTK